jgi:hypothetical protein
VLVADILFSLATALFLSVIIAVGFVRSAPLSSRWWLELVGFFGLIFLSSWAGGVWLRKSPAIGLAAPYVASIAIATIFLLSASRSSRAQTAQSAGVASHPNVAMFQAVLFVVLLVVLAVVIIFGYGREI